MGFRDQGSGFGVVAMLGTSGKETEPENYVEEAETLNQDVWQRVEILRGLRLGCIPKISNTSLLPYFCWFRAPFFKITFGIQVEIFSVASSYDP